MGPNRVVVIRSVDLQDAAQMCRKRLHDRGIRDESIRLGGRPFCHDGAPSDDRGIPWRERGAGTRDRALHSRSQIKFWAPRPGKASIICPAIHSAIGLSVTLTVTSLLRP